MQGFMWRCRASGCILVLNVAMHYNGSDRMHWFQGSASAVLMCGCSTHNPVCSCSTAVWVYCMTVWLYDCCREIWRILLATNHCTHCGGYAVVVAHTGDSSQILCGDNSPLMHTGMECTNQLGATILAATQNLHIESTTHTDMGCKNQWGATIFSRYKVNF